jgi:hypothetical protein
VRQVRSNCEIKWAGGLVYISAALAGEAVAMVETESGDCHRETGRELTDFAQAFAALRRLPFAAGLDFTIALRAWPRPSFLASAERVAA